MNVSRYCFQIGQVFVQEHSITLAQKVLAVLAAVFAPSPGKACDRGRFTRPLWADISCFDDGFHLHKSSNRKTYCTGRKPAWL